MAVWGGSPLTTLANSITLTPGTLTVRAEGQDLYVHALFPSAREGLFAGTLERAVRFVFYGRAAAAIATPAERGDTELLQRPEEDVDALRSGRSAEAAPEEAGSKDAGPEDAGPEGAGPEDAGPEAIDSEETDSEEAGFEESRPDDDRSDDDRTPPGDGGGA